MMNTSNPQPNQWLQWICSSDNEKDLREKYDQWASSYESDIANVWHSVPSNAALMLAKYMPNKHGLVLDVGVGTGLVGIELTSLGFESLAGIDISLGMLEQAEQKKVYRSLVCCSIGDDDFTALERPNGIVATGVFAATHAGPVELEILQSKIQPGGVIVFTARESFLPQLQSVLEQPNWTLLDQQAMPIYDDPMHLFAYCVNEILV